MGIEIHGDYCFQSFEFQPITPDQVLTHEIEPRPSEHSQSAWYGQRSPFN